MSPHSGPHLALANEKINIMNNIQFFKILIWLFLVINPFLDASPQVLNLAEFPAEIPADSDPIWSMQGRVVRIRGFWYPISSDEGMLAGSPQMKSCCIKAPSKITQQVLVKGSLASTIPQRAVTMEGIFRIDPRYNQEGGMVQYFVLDQAKEIHISGYMILIWIISGCGALCFSYLIFKK